MHPFYDDLEKALSIPRLLAFAANNPTLTEVDIVTRYVDNVQVATAMVPLLHLFEVSFRNGVNDAFVQIYGVDAWYDEEGLLGATQERQLAVARRCLKNSKKEASASRVVAELTLGFWVALFSAGYDRSIWRKHRTLLKMIFPEAPRAIRNRKSLSARLQPIRDLRNRVFHWERVSHDSDLAEKIRNIERLIRYLNPASHRLLGHCVDTCFVLSEEGRAEAHQKAQACFAETYPST